MSCHRVIRRVIVRGSRHPPCPYIPPSRGRFDGVFGLRTVDNECDGAGYTESEKAGGHRGRRGRRRRGGRGAFCVGREIVAVVVVGGGGGGGGLTVTRE